MVGLVSAGTGMEHVIIIIIIIILFRPAVQNNSYTLRALVTMYQSSEAQLTDAEDDEEDDVDNQLAQSRLDRQLLVALRVLHVLRRPDCCTKHAHNK